MNVEQQFQEMPSRVMQHKRERIALQMYDNRCNAAVQAKMLGTIQRQGEEDEEPVQGKFVSQRAEDDEEPVQGKFVSQLAEDDDELVQGKFDLLQRQADNHTGIPDAVKQRMEDSFGTDFSSVRVHPESSKAPEVGALAYTQGTDIHFAPGQFKPDTAAGRELLGHELTHVVQQSEGRVLPTTEISGMPVNDNEALEREADVMGAKAAG